MKTIIELPGYEVKEQVHQKDYSRIFRARKEENDQPVIIKLLNIENPTPHQIISFKREYEITNQLRLEGVIRVYGLEKYQNTFAIVEEDCGGDSLETYIKRKKFKLKEFLRLAIRIVDILGRVHSHFVIHKDINPSNIIWDPKTDALKLIDFGVSTTLMRENPEVNNPKVLEGTLAYISPEQTSRMNRGIDYRTDFYSLGVTFFQMLTRRLPFKTEDPMELVHSHIAKQPTPPHEIDPNIPEMISKIILKLMAKTAEERYQSTYGLKADLENCLKQLEEKKSIDLFPLAQHDLFEYFQIPEKLYGREREIEFLMNTFEEVSQGHTKLLLVAGYSGIGKSSLVREVQKPMVEKHGYFIAGKFDQYKQNIPYAPLVEAFEELVRQIITEEPDVVEQWKEKLLTAVGPNGGVITDVIPAFETLLGPQEKPPSLGPTETQNRFNYVFVNFVRNLASAEHPLVIFLDDLQWIDPSSVLLIKLLVTHPTMKHLLIIGAYRDNEVDKAHLLMMMLNDIKKRGTTFKTLTLSTLPLKEVNHLLSDTLHTSTENVEPLAKLCYEKTRGNPFFLNQLMYSLYKDELLRVDPKRARWVWNIEQIQKKGVTDNVVDLMSSKIQKLKSTTQNVLQKAACIGHRFDLKTLAIVYHKSMTETAADLWEGLQEGLIIPEDESYKFITETDIVGKTDVDYIPYRFLHDRVQQAAYSLIPKAKRASIHYEIGQLLVENTPSDQMKENIFDIVNQLNKGEKFIKEKEEIKQLIYLNFIAGERAKNATAFKSAVNYLKFAKAKLPPTAWDDYYQLTFDSLKMLAECLFIVGEFKAAEELIQTVLDNTKTDLEKSYIRSMQVIQYTCTGEFEKALDMGIKGLETLGLSLTKKPSRLAIFKDFILLKLYFSRKKISSLTNLPIMTDPRINSIVNILVFMAPPMFYRLKRRLLVYSGFRVIRLALKYGNSPSMAHFYVLYAILLTTLENFKQGEEFFNLSLSVNEKFNDLSQRSAIYAFYAAFSHPWTRSWKAKEEYAKKAIEVGLQTGDLMNVAIACTYAAGFDPEMSLPATIEEMKKYLNIVAQTKYLDMYEHNKMNIQFRKNFMGETKDRFSFSDAQFDETASLKRMQKRKYYNGIMAYYLQKSIVYYTYGDYRTALSYVKKIKERVTAFKGLSNYAEYCFYDFLICTAVYPLLSWKEKIFALRNMITVYRKTKKWAKYNPDNFQFKFLLMQAEIARMQHRNHKAALLYDQAIEESKKQGFLVVEAIANELAAKFYLAQGRPKIAGLYIMQARYVFDKWGAKRKVKHLEESYSELFAYETRASEASSTSEVPTEISNLKILDLDSVIKSSQTISGEIVLSKLLVKMMNVVIENAGAEKGWLILERDGEWLIEAEGMIDTKKVNVMQSKPINRLPTSIIRSVIYDKKPVVLGNATESTRFGNDPYIQRLKPKSAMCVPLLNKAELTGLLYLENNLTTDAFTPTQIATLNLLASQIAISVYNARLYTELKEVNESYECFVPKQFLTLLEKKRITDVKLGDQVQKEMTVMFCDIRDFTTFSEKMTPQQTLNFINGFYKRMEPIITKHNGIIDKYIGDAIMALYPGNADDALKSAIEMLSTLEKYNKERIKANKAPIHVGIGLNTGLLVLGTVGNEKRMESSVISDAVNIASRVERLTRNYDTDLLITKETYDDLTAIEPYALRKISTVVVKGKSKPVTIYEVFNHDSKALIEAKQKTLNEFEEAVRLYQNKKYEDALLIFESIADKNENDLPAKVYLKLCQEKLGKPFVKKKTRLYSVH